MMRSRLNSGFTLIEISLVLMIIGVLIAGAIGLGIRRDQPAKIDATEKKLERVEQALVSYLRLNRHLPCPAVGGTAMYTVAGTFNPVFGTADCVNTAATGANLLAGIIPYRTLGLPREMAFDAWDRRITYAIDRRYAGYNAGVGGPSSFIYEPAGTIVIQNYYGFNKATNAVYVLLSHGPSGHGAWPENPTSSASTARIAVSPAPAAEVANADTPATPQSFDLTFRQSEAANDFGHILLFKTKTQIARAAGAKMMHGACELARRTLCPTDATGTVIPSPGPQGCADSISADECNERQTTLARLIYERCFAANVTMGECK